jgi:tRNA/tmRNA/rRNA uracil-C5-methylase (TrmA/RlmC/RlmD family)
VRSCLSNAGTRFLVDTYCGIGFFSISLSDLVDSFVGIDIDKQCILPARENLENRGITNGEFILGKTEEHMDALLERFPADETTIILDPPRKGCRKEGLEMLLKAGPRQVIYVSCHPATLARDLKWLCENGYELQRVTPLDMFPQTKHVECVADLRRSG